jgi:processing peptidase subunit alpha
MLEAIHAAAFANNTLGLPKMCPKANVESAINRPVLMNFLKSYHTPDRMVLAGVGVDHDLLVEAAQVRPIVCSPN